MTAAEVRRFGWITFGGFAVIGALCWYLGRAPEAGWAWAGTARQIAAVLCWTVGASFAGICTLSHRLGLRLYIGWMTGATWIGSIMTVVVLSAIFLLVLPIFSLIRLKDPLRMRLRKDGTYWEDVEPYDPSLDRMMRPF